MTSVIYINGMLIVVEYLKYLTMHKASRKNQNIFIYCIVKSYNSLFPVL